MKELPKERVEKLKKMYFAHFGVELDNREANELAVWLIGHVKAVICPEFESLPKSSDIQ